MARTNRKPQQIHTHGGGIAQKINPTQQLRRLVMSCMLWEKEFYEDGLTITERIKTLIPLVKPNTVSEIAIEARSKMKLRHVPLLIVREMARLDTHKNLVKETLNSVIQRADELAEFLSIYWMDGKQPLSAQVKKGLAKAFTKFSEYDLQKYNRDNSIRLKDVLFLCHAKPKDTYQAALWMDLINDNLAIPETWETILSNANDKRSKKEKWESLLSGDKLGALALLRNLRNFYENKVNEKFVFSALNRVKTDRVLPFRFITAAKYAPQWEDKLEPVMFKCISESEKLKGKTILVIDVSGSMYNSIISEKSEITRADAACALAVLAREQCEDVRVYATAGNDYSRVHDTALVPSRHGFALRDVIHDMCEPLGGGGIFLKQVMDYIYQKENSADRVIVITDEQDCSKDSEDSPLKANAFGVNNYLINVASAENGIGYDKWVHLNGFSDAVLNYIIEYEKENLNGLN